MGWWAEQEARQADKRTIEAQARWIAGLEEQNETLRACNETLDAERLRLTAELALEYGRPAAGECSDCGRAVSETLGSHVVLCADCAGPVMPLGSALHDPGYRVTGGLPARRHTP